MSIDSQSRDVLSARAKGQFPISIATSLAIESAIGQLPEAPTDSPAILKCNLLMINLRTLVRNLTGSIETQHKTKITEYTSAEAIANEIRVIESVVSEHSDGRCHTLVYHCAYSDILRNFTKALIKTPSSAGQKNYAAFEHTVIKLLETEFSGGVAIQKLIRDFPETHADALLITHYPIDLLQRYKFSSVSLLESHTGAIKPPMLWNTKLHNGKELELLPFDRMTLQMFGDNILFSPMNLKIRRKVYEIAVNKHWTPATTKDYVIRSIEDAHDPALETLVKDLYRG